MITLVFHRSCITQLISGMIIFNLVERIHEPYYRGLAIKLFTMGWVL